MAGGPTTPELVAAVSNAGGLGSLGAEYLSPAQIEKDVLRIRELTQRPFAINLFSPDADQPLAGDFAPIANFMARHHQQLGIAPPQPPASPGENFREQMDVLIRLRVPVISTTLGLFPADVMERLKREKIYVIGTATTVEEARMLEQSGVDAITAQGSEAGGHRGTFTTDAEQVLIGTMSLVPQIVDAVNVPVLASGGIMDGRGIVAALTLGADAVQMGTAFLTCDEAGIPDAYKSAILSAREDQTRVTRAFSGRPARGIVNRLMRELGPMSPHAPPFPLAAQALAPLRSAAEGRGCGDFSPLWSGQNASGCWEVPAAVVTQELAAGV